MAARGPYGGGPMWMLLVRRVVRHAPPRRPAEVMGSTPPSRAMTVDAYELPRQKAGFGGTGVPAGEHLDELVPLPSGRPPINPLWVLPGRVDHLLGMDLTFPLH